MKLWNKEKTLDKAIESFTIGKDAELDLMLAEFDVLGSMAHVKMLAKTGFINAEEESSLLGELKSLHALAVKGELLIDEGIEDIHSQVEKMLTEKLGETGKKVHTARSRNDQVLLDLKLFSRSSLEHVSKKAGELFDLLLELSEKNKDVLMPGYTHMQAAMPSSFGLWLGAFAESLADDMIMLKAAYDIADQNPLGSAAGYGSSFAIDRQMTTDLLGFSSPVYNSIYAQAGRAKTEKTVAFALSSVASTLSRLAMDITLFMGQNFNFFSLPEELVTGSSIMPHKKNPDVMELIRAKCNKIQALPVEISMISGNLATGYHRDYQLLKESFLPAFSSVSDSLDMAYLVLKDIVINKELLEEDRYKYIFSVEEINKEVSAGTPFREAYHKVASSIKDGSFKAPGKIEHTHMGSTGNLCSEDIRAKMEKTRGAFNFEKASKAFEELLK